MTLEQRIDRAEKRAQHLRSSAVTTFDEALGCANLGMGKRAARTRREAEDLEENAKIWDSTAEVLRGELQEQGG